MSTVVAATATSPAGPFVRKALVIGTQCHNPYYAFDLASGTHLIFHIGSGDTPAGPNNRVPSCSNGTTPGMTRPFSPFSAAAMATPTAATDPEYAAQPFLSVSKSLDGPFKPVNFTLPPGHTALGWGNDNPAPYVFENGTVLMLTRKYNGTAAKLHIVPHDTIWRVRAPSYEGPYELVFNRPVFPHQSWNDEDPCIYRDHRGPLPRPLPLHPRPRLVARWDHLGMGRWGLRVDLDVEEGRRVG